MFLDVANFFRLCKNTFKIYFNAGFRTSLRQCRIGRTRCQGEARREVVTFYEIFVCKERHFMARKYYKIKKSCTNRKLNEIFLIKSGYSFKVITAD